MSVYWTEGVLKGMRIIARESDGSCWVAISESEKVALENHGADVAIVTDTDVKKKLPLTSLNMVRVSQLTYPILMTQMEGEISEAKAAELIGVDIVSLRVLKTQVVKSIMDLLESLPSPLTLLLEGMKEQQKLSAKNGE